MKWMSKRSSRDRQKRFAKRTGGIRADHDPEMLMFDVPPPFLSRRAGGIHGDLGNVFVVVREASRL
jgi:hypothetical protein